MTKKILLVTETPPGTPNGFGVTLVTLLSGLNCKVIFTDAFFKSTGKNKGFLHAHCPYHKSRKYLFLFLLGLIPEWRGNFSKLWLFLFLREKFDIVYSFFYSFDNILFASWIATQKKCKHIVHIADHSPLFFESLEFKNILENSYKRACIGHNMREEYKKKFNMEFEVFHNYADTDHLPLPKIQNCTFDKKNPFKVLFLGSLFSHLHKGAINDICKAIKILEEEDHPIVFNLYGQRVPSDFLSDEINGNSVIHHGEVTTEKRFEIMKSNHLFVVPSSFDEKISGQYRFSIPTKLPELLSSGRPTIVYGPKLMEANRFCRDNNCGILIDEKSVDNLKVCILKIMLDYKKCVLNSLSQTKNIKGRISQSSQVPRFHDFLLK